MIVYKNGKQQLVMEIRGKAKKSYAKALPEEIERGKIRKAIEDRKIEKELLEADPW